MHHITIVHSSSERKPLYIELLPNFTITVQSRRKAQALFEKIIVPFGIHTDQVLNLIDIAARDIYYNHFGDSVDLYLSDNRRLTATVSAKKEEHTSIFNYVFKHQHELKIILASSKHIQDALLFEFVSPN